MLLGAVADDLTGATDLALMLSREGMRTIQIVGVPPADFDPMGANAVVVALKSRTIPAAQAIADTVASAKALLAAGARQLVFKYCSTFDSTPQGNIGPVSAALLDLMGDAFTIACPAFPANGRTVYRGHLFVDDVLLSESPMKDHPLTPMRDSNLVRVLQKQTDLTVGLIAHDVVRDGAAAISREIERAKARGVRIAIVDATDETDLRRIGRATRGLKLITGGSGIALGLPESFREAGLLAESRGYEGFGVPQGRSVMLAGSCSAATRRQVAAAAAAKTPSLKLDPLAIAEGRESVEGILDWIEAQDSGKTPLVYSSADPREVDLAQAKLGRDRAGALVEDILAETAARLKERGFTRFMVAGGETSGAVVAALGVRALEIGPEIDPGVPWTRSIGSEPPIALVLKSGNFGADDFFLKAWTLIK
jgi:uncharacterized protein YgbK (DUF1537 family)